jgi:hypothetical protein
MTAYSGNRTFGITSLTIGSDTYSGMANVTINKPASPVVSQADNALYPQDSFLDGGLVTIDIVGTMPSITGSGTLLNLIGGADISTFTLVIPSRPTGTKTISLVATAKAVAGACKQDYGHARFGEEQISFAFYISTGVMPIQEVTT